jgi:hypothetical protein
MVKSESVEGMEIVGDKLTTCTACLKGKKTHNTISHTTKEQETEVLGRVFSDLCGPIKTPTKEGYRYFITLMDDYSCYTHVGFCVSKDHALDTFKTWKACAEKETRRPMKIFRGFCF